MKNWPGAGDGRGGVRGAGGCGVGKGLRRSCLFASSYDIKPSASLIGPNFGSSILGFVGKFFGLPPATGPLTAFPFAPAPFFGGCIAFGGGALGPFFFF